MGKARGADAPPAAWGPGRAVPSALVVDSLLVTESSQTSEHRDSLRVWGHWGLDGGGLRAGTIEARVSSSTAHPQNSVAAAPSLFPVLKAR